MTADVHLGNGVQKRHIRNVPKAFEKGLVLKACMDAFVKLNPIVLIKNPVIFVVEISAAMTTLCALQGGKDVATVWQIAVWLWLTVLFATFAESIAEGKGKARANSLRSARSDTPAKRLRSAVNIREYEKISSAILDEGDVVLVEAGDFIPGDGEIIQGIAMVDESAITGESAAVIRESGGDRSAVTGGTKVVSDWIVVRITVRRGESFLDRMISLVEGAKRQKTPNEIALNVLLFGLSIIFMIVIITLPAFGEYAGVHTPVAYLVALLITLLPTTISGLLSAIGIAGMDRLIKFNVIAKSGRAVEAAGDVDVLLLDKTGTITYGNRMASDFMVMAGVDEKELAEAAYLSSLSDDTPEGKSIVKLAFAKFGFTTEKDGMTFIPFTAKTRMSGIDQGDLSIRKGAIDAILALVEPEEAKLKGEYLQKLVSRISSQGGTPLAVAKNGKILGAIYLKDVIKKGLKERFQELRKMGIRTVMITGDNPLTAAAIAGESGVDDFLAEATPERKLELIRKFQNEGRLVAMCGDGSNDAPALAQADVGIAMNTGTQAAREAGNMVDLDSDPTKLIEVVMIGKQLLMSRGALTTFSIANDVAKYFAIIPALFVVGYPQLQAMNIMHLQSPESAILSAIIFNALIVVALIPLALRGVNYTPMEAKKILSRNMLIYGLGGLIVPFIGIKLIDMAVNALGLV